MSRLEWSELTRVAEPTRVVEADLVEDKWWANLVEDKKWADLVEATDLVKAADMVEQKKSADLVEVTSGRGKISP